MKKSMTLCFVLDEERVLLGFKKRGFGAGRWNGFGGKTHEGEPVLDAARRELWEESGLAINDLTPRGILTFTFENDPVTLEVHVFSTSSWNGIPTESDEMRPAWFRHDSVPYDMMWPDDRLWLPQMLAGKNINGLFHFKDVDTMLTYKVMVTS